MASRKAVDLIKKLQEGQSMMVCSFFCIIVFAVLHFEMGLK